MKVLVSGAKGQLGYDLVKRLNALGIENRGVDIDDFDLTDEEAVMDYVKNYSPDVIIHSAAYTAVDAAEDNREICYKVNVDGTKNIAKAASSVGAVVMYFSTDYVFDGEGDGYFKPEDKKAPINYYGLTKSLGEDVIIDTLEKYFIVRISWVFGINGKNFVKTMQKLGEQKEEINVVCDQIGSPTYTYDLARLVCDMIQTKKYGIYHAANEGICSWADFAKAIMEFSNLNCKVNEITSSEYPSKAKRPANSRLCKDKLDACGFTRLPDWQDALKRYIQEENSL